MNKTSRRINSPFLVHAFALTAAVGLVCANSALAAGFNAQLQGQDSTSTNWVGGPLNGWEELDYIPCRVALSGGPSTNQVITVTFEHLRSGVPAIQDLYSFTHSANVIIASAPVLNSPIGVDIWDYTFTIHITNSASGEVQFLARLSSGAHNAPGSSISLGGTPSLGNLGIAKPTAKPGNPDLSLTKAGPTNANPGQVIKYVVRYNASSTADDAVDVQVTDQLPGLVIFDQCLGGCTNLASALSWDLGDLVAGSRGRLVYSVTVSNSATAGQTFQNSALIACPQSETTLTNNSGSILTTVVGPCVPPSIADSPQSTTNCANGSVTLDVIANGSGTLLYQWLKASSAITAATNDTYTIASLSTNDAGSYNVIVSNSCGSVTSAVAVLAVTTAPTCSISGSSSVCPFTSNLTYSVSTSANAPTYSWSVTGNGSIAGATSNSSVTVHASTSGSFTVISSVGEGSTDCSTTCSNAVVVSSPPTATDDSYHVNEDSTLTVPALGVIANDTDPDGDTLTTVSFGSPTHGALILNANGSFTYVPTNNFNGSDSFTYKATDGCSTSGIATVSITVDGVPDAPVIQNSTPSVNEDTALIVPVPGVLTNAFDGDGDAITAVLVTNVTHGTLIFNADGSYSYTPTNNFNGTDCFAFVGTDGTLTSSVGTVCITINAVNDPPTVVGSNPNVDEDTMLDVPAPGVLTGATDVDGGSMVAILVTNVMHGTLSFSTNGSYSYTPTNDFNGTDCFAFAATDGVSTSATASVCITINSVPDAPVIQNSTPSVNEDTALIVPVPGVLTNAFDGDGDSITAVLVTNVTHGTLIFNADGSYSYTPTNNFNGTDCFAFVGTDGTLTSSVGTVCITINAVNDPPTVVGSNPNVDEDTMLDVPAPGVLTGATDVDDGSLVAILVTNVMHGTLSFSTNGSYSYMPTNDFNGTDCFAFAATDGVSTSATASVCITINSIPDAPVVQNSTPSMNEDTALIVPVPGVLTNAYDGDGDPISAILISNVTHGTLSFSTNGSYSYTPTNDFFGTDCFAFVGTDGTFTSGVATVCVTVSNVNDAPVVQSFTPMVLNNGSLDVAPSNGVLSGAVDVDGDPLSAILITNVMHGTLSFGTNGSYSYMPTNTFVGTDCFTFAATDGTTTSAYSTVCVTVNSPNTAPVANADNYTTAEDIPLIVAVTNGVLANDIDLDTNTLAVVVVADPTHGTVSLHADGSFTYTPTNNFNGSDSFTYKANDGEEDSNVATVSIAVTAVNDPPSSSPITFDSTEDSLLEVPAPGVLTNAVDIDSPTLTAVLVSNASHGTLALNSDGSFSYLPLPNFIGDDTFSFAVSDGSAQSAPVTVTVSVAAVEGADDADLYVKSLRFTQHRTVSDRDRLSITGRVNPRGARIHLDGATLTVTINGLPVGVPIVLDSAGRGTTAVGRIKIRAFFSSTSGSFRFSISGVDLSDVLALSNVTETGLTNLDVLLTIVDANLDVLEIGGLLQTPYATVVDKGSTARFKFNSNRTLTGVFQSNRTRAIQGADGDFLTSFSGVIDPKGGGSILPTGTIRITIGDHVMDVPLRSLTSRLRYVPSLGEVPGLARFTINNASHRFRISTTEIPDTAIPLKGETNTNYRLPMSLEIPTVGGTNLFDTIIELKRRDSGSTVWKR